MHRHRKPQSLAMICLLLLAFTATVMAQQAQTPAPAQQGQTAAKPFKPEELAALLAPIALYPDSVVTQILMASTYPLEVVQAQRWLQQNKNLTGEALATAAQKQPWDASVQALVAIPDVLKMMDEKLDWTQKVGDAFLAQQKEVMDTIQMLRRKAKEAGNLKSDDHMKVSSQPVQQETTGPATTDGKTTVVQSSAPEVIVIESANPQVVYVPTYSSTTVYGGWMYPAYPPYYYPPPMGYPGSGFWYGAAIGISIGYWGGHYNNCYPDWHGGQVNIGEINIGSGNIGSGNRGQAQPKGGTGGRAGATAGTTQAGGGKAWQHNPEHRQGVSYRDSGSQSKYGGASGASAGTRDAYRGRDGGSGASAGTMDRGGASSRNLGSSPSAGTMDRGAGGGGSMRELGPTPSDLGRGAGASAGTRDAGSGFNSGSRGSAGASASTRDFGGSSSRGSSGYSGGSSSRGGSSAFGGMSSGASASSYGSRGGMSRGGGGGRGGRR